MIDTALNNGQKDLVAPAVVDYMSEDRLEHVHVNRESLREFFASYHSEVAFTYENRMDGKKTPVFRLMILP